MRVLNHISKKVIFESMTAKTIKELVSEADLTGANLGRSSRGKSYVL